MRRLLAMSLALLAFVSCGGDDDDDESAPAESTSVADTTATTTRATTTGATTTGATTTGAVSDPATWTYRDLNGQEVTITEGEGTSFQGDIPQPVSIIDGFASDCTSLRGELNSWLSRLDDPAIGEQASAYAQYAFDLGNRIGCEWT